MFKLLIACSVLYFAYAHFDEITATLSLKKPAEVERMLDQASRAAGSKATAASDDPMLRQELDQLAAERTRIAEERKAAALKQLGQGH